MYMYVGSCTEQVLKYTIYSKIESTYAGGHWWDFLFEFFQPECVHVIKIGREK